MDSAHQVNDGLSPGGDTPQLSARERPAPDPDRPAGPGSAGREMSIVLRHLEEAVAAMAELLAVLRETPAATGAEVPEQVMVAEELLPVVEEQIEDCRALTQGGGQDPAVGATVATRGAAIADTAERAGKRWPNKWWQKVWDAISSSASWLAPAICRLTSVREWTLTGQVSMPGIAQASVSVTFGRPLGTPETTLSRQNLSKTRRTKPRTE